MKSFFTALTALFFLNSSYACPNLSGIYYCVDKDGNYEVENSQMEEDGVTIFNTKRSEDTHIFEADGIEKPYTVNDDGKEITLGKITAFCKDEKLYLNLFLNEEDNEVNQVKATLTKVEDVIKITAISRLKGQVVETKTSYCVPKNL